MNRRGQIFLIMTILVISFMIGITTVLLDIQRADFLEPAPDSASTLQTWELTIDSIIQIMDLELAIDNSAGVKNISIPINDLSTYLTGRGISNAITLVAADPVTVVNTNTPTSQNFLQISGSFDLFLASSSVTIEQTIEINIQYTMITTAGTVTISKSVNGNTQFLPQVTFDQAVVDNGNGSYDHSIPSTTVLTATTFPIGVVLVATIP